MLNSETILNYLLQERWITPEAVVVGDFSILETQARNTSFQVVSSVGDSFLLKNGSLTSRPPRIVDEARVLRFLWMQSISIEIRQYIPLFFGYDANTDLLILELFTNSESLLQYQLRTKGVRQYPALHLGLMLGALHKLCNIHMTVDINDRDVPVALKPWALDIHRPGLEMFHEMSFANNHFVSLIQTNPPFESLLDELGREWQTSHLIHGDLKWNNCLLVKQESIGSRTQASPIGLKVIDWEFGGWGDGCWDLGSVVADYLYAWLMSIPLNEQLSGIGTESFAYLPIQKMQPALRLFWRQYCTHSDLENTSKTTILHRSLRFAAARLLQLGYEQNQYTSHLTGSMVLLLQLSLNILLNPPDAAKNLLGLD